MFTVPIECGAAAGAPADLSGMSLQMPPPLVLRDRRDEVSVDAGESDAASAAANSTARRVRRSNSIEGSGSTSGASSGAHPKCSRSSRATRAIGGTCGPANANANMYYVPPSLLIGRSAGGALAPAISGPASGGGQAPAGPLASSGSSSKQYGSLTRLRGSPGPGPNPSSGGPPGEHPQQQHSLSRSHKRVSQWLHSFDAVAPEPVPMLSPGASAVPGNALAPPPSFRHQQHLGVGGREHMRPVSQPNFAAAPASQQQVQQQVHLRAHNKDCSPKRSSRGDASTPVALQRHSATASLLTQQQSQLLQPLAPPQQNPCDGSGYIAWLDASPFHVPHSTPVPVPMASMSQRQACNSLPRIGTGTGAESAAHAQLRHMKQYAAAAAQAAAAAFANGAPAGGAAPTPTLTPMQPHAYSQLQAVRAHSLEPCRSMLQAPMQYAGPGPYALSVPVPQMQQLQLQMQLQSPHPTGAGESSQRYSIVPISISPVGGNGKEQHQRDTLLQPECVAVPPVGAAAAAPPAGGRAAAGVAVACGEQPSSSSSSQKAEKAKHKGSASGSGSGGGFFLLPWTKSPAKKGLQKFFCTKTQTVSICDSESLVARNTHLQTPAGQTPAGPGAMLVQGQNVPLSGKPVRISPDRVKAKSKSPQKTPGRKSSSRRRNSATSGALAAQLQQDQSAAVAASVAAQQQQQQTLELIAAAAQSQHVFLAAPPQPPPMAPISIDTGGKTALVSGFDRQASQHTVFSRPASNLSGTSANFSSDSALSSDPRSPLHSQPGDAACAFGVSGAATPGAGAGAIVGAAGASGALQQQQQPTSGTPNSAARHHSHRKAGHRGAAGGTSSGYESLFRDSSHDSTSESSVAAILGAAGAGGQQQHPNSLTLTLQQATPAHNVAPTALPAAAQLQPPSTPARCQSEPPVEFSNQLLARSAAAAGNGSRSSANPSCSSRAPSRASGRERERAQYAMVPTPSSSSTVTATTARSVNQHSHSQTPSPYHVALDMQQQQQHQPQLLLTDAGSVLSTSPSTLAGQPRPHTPTLHYPYPSQSHQHKSLQSTPLHQSQCQKVHAGAGGSATHAMPILAHAEATSSCTQTPIVGRFQLPTNPLELQQLHSKHRDQIAVCTHLSHRTAYVLRSCTVHHKYECVNEQQDCTP